MALNTNVRKPSTKPTTPDARELPADSEAISVSHCIDAEAIH